MQEPRDDDVRTYMLLLLHTYMYVVYLLYPHTLHAVRSASQAEKADQLPLRSCLL